MWLESATTTCTFSTTAGEVTAEVTEECLAAWVVFTLVICAKSAGTVCMPHHILLVMYIVRHVYFCGATVVHTLHDTAEQCKTLGRPQTRVWQPVY